MRRLLLHHVEAPRSCPYLGDRDATLEHRFMEDVDPAELEALLVRGWRRFGFDYFRPACAGCAECQPTRVVVDGFVPTRSQRRAIAGARGWEAHLERPIVDRERLELHARWHADREVARAWSPTDLDAEGYALQLAWPHPAARELSFRDAERGHRLVGVGLCDETPDALSAVYFFFDPEYGRASPGVVNVVTTLEIARAAGKSHVYLGYRVDGCPSLAYKGRFKPQERLVGAPADDEEPRWVAA
ncbi:MAG: arginyltransferase [Myxococcales bacterium]|nr:arginyltransferase [Myxococcales bacterium]